MPPPLRKTRFVCVSDTHNASPANGAFKLPKGDVLIHAGDLTNQGNFFELKKTVEWIEQADFEVKLVIAGNHDITLDPTFYSEHGLRFHNQVPQSSPDCIRLLKASPSITYLNHETAEVYLTKNGGPRTTFKAFGSPYSPARGLWAFGYSPKDAAKLWHQIPLDTDILVTHTPPKHHCDESRDRGSVGCGDLRKALWRIRPSLVVCGHVHDGRGAERVLWDLTSPNVKYQEQGTEHVSMPPYGSKKQCLVSLTANGGNALRNISWQAGVLNDSEETPANTPSKVLPGSALPSVTSSREPLISQIEILQGNTVGASSWPNFDGTVERYGFRFATHGQGGVPPSGHCDTEALSRRLGRKETCVVNAAITAKSWPHDIADGKIYNQPVVVDIDLPVWDEYSKEEH